MSRFEQGPAVEIAALRMKQAADVDVMAAGDGTPWEDRGTRGVVPAFFMTAFMAIARPQALYSLMRRPDSAGDANPFTVACGAMWSLAFAILFGKVWASAGEEFDVMGELLFPVVQVLGAPVALFALRSLALGVFNRLVATELRKGTPSSLATNVFSYALGPSVLAPVLLPFHWALGGLIVASVVTTAIVGARTRMRLSVAGAVVGVLLSVFSAVSIAVVAYFAVRWLWALVSL